jgi:putative transposase
MTVKGRFGGSPQNGHAVSSELRQSRRSHVIEYGQGPCHARAKVMKKISYRGYRFPPEIIQRAIWLYLRFTLSLRDIEDLLAERGIIVSYETVRRWVNHFGPLIAADLRKRRPKPHTTWHLDEVYLKIAGRMVYLWRDVDAEGEVLDVLVQSRRNKRAALKLMRKLLKKYGFVPDKLVTDSLRSYAAAASDLGIARRHERGRWRNKSSREFPSTDPTTRIQDAGFQEPGVRAKISLDPRSHLQHLQRPTSSHLSKNAPSLPDVGHANVV